MRVLITSSISEIVLPKGCYSVQVHVDNKPLWAELTSANDRDRGCVMAANESYLLNLRKPLEHARLRLFSEIEPNRHATPQIEVSSISPLQFAIGGIMAALRRHALQSFGPGEKLIARGMTKKALENSAFKNAEFRSLRLYGLDDASIETRNWPWIENGWQNAGPTRRRQGDSARNSVCVYVHMHYWDTWPEIESVLLGCDGDFDLVISSTSKRDMEFESVRSHFPKSQILVVENRGRDVGPFMQLLKDGVFAQYAAVCKIHGKRSIKGGRDTVSGVRIRRYTLACLVAEGAFERARLAFETDETLGIAGPSNLLLPLPDRSPKRHIKDELKQIKQVFKRAQEKFKPDDVQFFAGTMFWFRPSALDGLRRAGIGLIDFQLENGAKRKTLQHAIERVFCTFAKQAGYGIIGLEPVEGGDGEERRFYV